MGTQAGETENHRSDAQLWRVAGQEIDEVLLDFTTDEDQVLDLQLLPYDCLASYAHAEMLNHIGVISDPEWAELKTVLRAALSKTKARELSIRPEDEDGHTVLERFLTGLTAAGEKIHTARSRNDQVIQALRLLVRHHGALLGLQGVALAEALLEKGKEWHSLPIPGFTHTRFAMPSSLGQLFFGHAELLIEGLLALLPALVWADRCALGSASGYGVPLPIDRERVAKTLRCASVQINTIAVQNSRGPFEAEWAFACHRLAAVVGRLSDDVILLSSEPYGFFKLPEFMTTGSSIMPQKRNPDVFELLRAMPSRSAGALQELLMLTQGMTSGYHRDLQRSKGPMLRTLADIGSGLRIGGRAVRHLEANPDACAKALSPELFDTDRVYALVRQGKSFRKAYRAIKESPGDRVPENVLGRREHLGAPGSDQSEVLRQRLEQVKAEFDGYRIAHEALVAELNA